MADLRHSSWRAWRRTRPFWGGLLLAVAGVELIGIPLSGVLSHGAVKLVIYIGIGGVFGVLIGVLLIACGAAVCLNPAHRVFYGIAGVLLGILSFPASNLGGFFVGMLLAITGGSMAFAWTLADQPPFEAAGPPAAGRLPGDPPAYQPEYEPADDLADEPTDEIAGELEDEPPADGRPGGAVPGAHRQRMLAIAALAAIMLAGVLGAPGARAVSASPQGSGGSCILGIICLPSPTPTATPAPSPSAAPQPSAASPGSGAQPGRPGHPGKRGSAARRAHAGGLVAATATSVITAGSATLDHLVYQGAANVPAASGGTVRMMKFTATSITLSGGVTATVTQGGAGGKGGAGGTQVTTLTASPTLAFSGGVVLYATRLSGCLGALCVTLTPDNAVTVLLQLAGGVTGALTLMLTKVTTDQPLVTAGALQAGALKISFG
jgi:Family of unknown function (DUF6114)